MKNPDELQAEAATPARPDNEPSGETAKPEPLTAPETERRDKNPPERTKPVFIIRRKPESGDSVIRDVSLESLLERYPILRAQHGLDTTECPLLVITEDAERIIKEHISWGEKTGWNVREQGGLLIGQPVRVKQRVIGLVESAIPAELTRSSAAYLEMGVDTWTKMLDIFDERYSGKGLRVIGWYHTHPNGLPVFMSGTDRGTQRTFFNRPWHFAAVLNPHQKLLACFHSAEATKCEYCPKTFTD